LGRFVRGGEESKAKEPKPDNQKTRGEVKGRKAVFKSSDKPKFIEALMLRISLNPSAVKCSLFLNNFA